MSPAATVLIPTHSHGRLLRLSVESVRAQTVADLEILIIGDGATPETEEVARALEAADDRVRFFSYPKGERHGEAYRHVALSQAAAPVVCYLSDDDLWLPDHVEYMISLLHGNDFAHTLPLRVMPDGAIDVFPGDLASEGWRKVLLTRRNFVPLPASAHTLDFYRRLPYGWRPAPPSLPTDLYMWRQILSVPGCRAVSGSRPTLVHFPSSLRGDMDLVARHVEQQRWAARLSNSQGRSEFIAEVGQALTRQLARTSLDLENTAWPRMRRTIAKIPGTTSLWRWVGKARAGRAGR